MNREAQLSYCKVCQNHKFSPQQGIICSLTGQPATFENECEDFSQYESIGSGTAISNEPLLDNSKRASLAIKVFMGLSAVSFIALVSGYFEFELLEKIRYGYYDEDAVDSNDMRQAIVGILQLSLSIASIITFLNWFRRAYGNLERVNVKLEHKESMAAWSFFIPFVSLYRPFQIAKEIALETSKKLSFFTKENNSTSSFPIIGVWWAFFLIGNAIGQIAFRTSLRDETIEDMITSTQLYMLSDFIDIIGTIVTVLLIRKISEGETRLFQFMNS